MKKFSHYKQAESKDCGPTCIKIVAKHYGKTIHIQNLRDLAETTREGSSLLGLSEAAEKIGFHTIGVKVNFEKLLEAPLPCIVHWNKNHFAVLYKIKNAKPFSPFGRDAEGRVGIYISDPAHGRLEYTKEQFIKHWIGNNADDKTEEGVALLIEPTPKFYKDDLEDEEDIKFDFKFISKYLLRYKKLALVYNCVDINF